jgi:hypothetical protein
MIFAVNDGSMMRNVVQAAGMSAAKQRDRQLSMARTLWRLLFAEAAAA